MRRLVVLFVTQNLLLVASSVLRTMDYVEAYGLTQLRLAALAWMALVAVGLVLICVRLLRDRSSSWLINTNATAAALALIIASLVDLGASAATWNSRNAREVAGHGPRLDLCYLEALGPAALVPLTELEGRPLPSTQAQTVTSIRIRVLTDLDRRQANWRTWSWRDARRLEAARALMTRHPTTLPWPTRDCEGRLFGAESGHQTPEALTGASLNPEHEAMPQRILIVDDDPHIRQLLVFALEKAGFATIEAEDGEAALARAADAAPDLVVLDINMPRMNGLEVCRRLRGESDVPILFLSSRDEEIDRVLGIEARRRRLCGQAVQPARGDGADHRDPAPNRVPGAEGRSAVLGSRASWPGSRRLIASWDGQELALTVTEFGILRALAAAPSKVFTRDAIIDRLRGPGFAITDRTVDSHVRNLRGKFAQVGAHDVVETRPGVGYRLGACQGGAA
ncbi:DUF4153 domain-containing protein [Caulobacter segnis]